MKREEAKKVKTPNLKDGETWGEAADKDKKDRGSAIWHFFDRVLDDGESCLVLSNYWMTERTLIAGREPTCAI